MQDLDFSHRPVTDMQLYGAISGRLPTAPFAQVENVALQLPQQVVWRWRAEYVFLQRIQFHQLGEVFPTLTSHGREQAVAGLQEPYSCRIAVPFKPCLLLVTDDIRPVRLREIKGVEVDVTVGRERRQEFQIHTG